RSGRHDAHGVARRRYPEGRRPRSAGAAQSAAARLHGHRHSRRNCVSGDAEMTDARKLFVAVACGVVAAFVNVHSQTTGSGGGLNPANILKPLGESWSTYSGDYSGKRYSTLTQINQATVKNLTLAWTMRLAAGAGG